MIDDDKNPKTNPEPSGRVFAVGVVSGNTSHMDWIEELNVESDRAVAVLAAAYLENLLGDLLGAHFVPHKAARAAVRGPLGRFSTRIDVAFLLGLIGEIDRDDLHVIREVRNEFAHHLAGVTFETPTVAEKCNRVRLMPAMGWRFDKSGVPDVPLARLQYLTTATTLAGLLHNKIVVTPHTARIEMLANTDLPNVSRG